MDAADVLAQAQDAVEYAEERCGCEARGLRGCATREARRPADAPPPQAARGVVGGRGPEARAGAGFS
jgi:hypothetical protein